MPKRILVLDDNKDLLDMVNEVLSYENFHVHATSTSDDIIQVAQKYNPDLVILDYHLSAGSSDDICRQLKADEQLGNVPVIIFSAYINRNSNYTAYNCEAVIAKPFNLAELVDKVTALTAQN